MKVFVDVASLRVEALSSRYDLVTSCCSCFVLLFYSSLIGSPHSSTGSPFSASLAQIPETSLVLEPP